MSRLLAMLVLVTLLPSCKTAAGPELLQRHPRADGDASYWAEVAELEGRRGDTTRSWLLPFLFSREDTRVSEDGTSAVASSETTVNLGFATVPLLPLWHGVERVRVTPEGREPLSSVSWSPLWAGSSYAPDADERYDVFGVPLIYGGFDHHDGDGRASVRQVLWTLGPMYADFEDMWDDELDGYAFTPLFLGGLGPILWTSLGIEDEDYELDLHGPLGLVWIDATERLGLTAVGIEDAQPLTSTRVRLAVGGFLWTGLEEFDEDGALVDARYGPLWTAFGYGRDDGDTFFTFLWIPIPF